MIGLTITKLRVLRQELLTKSGANPCAVEFDDILRLDKRIKVLNKAMVLGWGIIDGGKVADVYELKGKVYKKV